MAIDSYKWRSTVIIGDRQLSPSTVISVDGQLIPVDGQLLTVEVKKERGTFDGPNKPR